MSKRTFEVALYVTVEIDDAVFASVLTDEWRGHHYALHTPEDVAEHLAFNLVNGRALSSLDGFADLEDDAASVVETSFDGATELP
jgi:hypothetical protein